MVGIQERDMMALVGSMYLNIKPLSNQFWGFNFVCTVKLSDKELLDSKQPGNSEPFRVTNLSLYFINTLISLRNVESRLLILKKNPPSASTHISTLHAYWFLRFFPPSTPRLLHLYTSFFQKITPSTFIPTSTAIREMRVLSYL